MRKGLVKLASRNDMISNFNISFKSPRNNSIKPFQFYLIVLSLHIAFSLGSGNEKPTTTTSRQQEFEHHMLS